jgi:integrase
MAFDTTGIFSTGDKTYGYRIKKVINGKKVDINKVTDENNQPFTSMTAAKRARDKRLAELYDGVKKKEKKEIKLREVWEHYSKYYNRDNKKDSSFDREESIWRIHIEKKFGNKYLSDITIDDYTQFISDTIDTGRSIAYCNSFISVLSNIYNHATRVMKVLDIETYNEMFTNKETKIREKMKTYDELIAEELEEENLVVFTSQEISEIDKRLKGTNLYMAFLFGYFCGLRIGEVFGLMWDDYNWEDHTIRITKQMVYSKRRKCMTITTPKSVKSIRVIDVPQVLHDELLKFYNQHEELRQTSPNYSRNAREIILDLRREHEAEIEGGNFINRKKDGTLLTINSMKHWADEIKEKDNIYFKFHSLRKTHLTQLASMGTPPEELMWRAGHSKYETTLKYYIKKGEDGTREILLENINQLTLEEKFVEANLNGFMIKMKESEYNNYKKQMEKTPH